MRIVEGISIGISAIRSNKMRSLLTMLGIIIGIASVLAMIEPLVMVPRRLSGKTYRS